VIAREGLVEIEVPRISGEKGPAKSGGVFYNRAMVFNRDITIALLLSQNFRGTCLDGMGASGVRGLRIAREVGCPVVINDWSAEAVEWIKKNARRNALEVEITRRNVNALLHERKFDYVDIDPYGSPAPYLPAAVAGVRAGGILGITATDTAVLFGTYARKCLRRYFARNHRGPYSREMGVRILLASVVREAARLDTGIRPLLSFSHDHYVRVFVRLERGAAKADECVESIKEMEWEGKTYGPLWTGDLHDVEVVHRLNPPDYMESAETIRELRDIWANENIFGFYDTVSIAAAMGVDIPPIRHVISSLRDAGYRAHRTHFCPTGIKTDAPREAVLRAVTGESISGSD
jgi:tRNA (guanine26-N2/guanine27-N2)-dimethyltransferase